jgi:hypothetical protein
MVNQAKQNQIDSFVEAFVQALHDQNAAIFAGAGLSIPAGFVNWKELLRKIAKELGLDVDKEHDLISIAQFHVNERGGGRHQINQTLIHEFAIRARPTANHALLASLPIKTFWTTNYDSLIEESLRAHGKKADVKTTIPNLAVTVHRRDAVVYKMHGDAAHPDEAIVTKDDYESYETRRHLFSTALQGDLVSKTFLFIGFSFNDPNLNYILGRIRVLLGENRREHYCFLRRVQRNDFKNSKEYEYAKAKQDLQVKDLRRYGIVGLLLDSYSEATDILRRIFYRYKLARVFVSGSAAEYKPWSEEGGQQLVQELSAALIREGFGIVSGFGVGIGAYVLNGLLRELENEGTRVLDDRIALRPFPIAIKDAAERKLRWTAYREDMLAQAGIAIFLFGNKRNSAGGISLADGMEEEFRLATQKKIFVVPVGCTGGMAAVLHKKVLDEFNEYFHLPGYRRLFEALGKPGTVSQVTARILKITKKLWADRSLAREK